MSYDREASLMSCPRTHPIPAHSLIRPQRQPFTPALLLAIKTIPFIPTFILPKVDVPVLTAVSQNFNYGLFESCLTFFVFFVAALIYPVLTHCIPSMVFNWPSKGSCKLSWILSDLKSPIGGPHRAPASKADSLHVQRHGTPHECYLY